MSKSWLKKISLSLVTAVLFAQVIDKHHLHITDSADATCQMCAHTDKSDAQIEHPELDVTEHSVAVAYESAVSATLAIRPTPHFPRAPPKA